MGHEKRKVAENYMTWSNYSKSVRKNQQKVYELNLDTDKCWFLDLTLSKPLEWNDLLHKYRIFIQAIRRLCDSKVEYVRAIEFQGCKRLHIHTILKFEEKTERLPYTKINSY